MPGKWHVDFVQLIKKKPKVPVTILREVMGVDIPPDAPAKLTSETLNDKPSDDLIPDVVILIGPEDAPLRVVIVEVQSKPLKSKRRQIPRYAMAAWLQHECPVDVLVICPNEKTAAWYAAPLPTALHDCLYRPKPVLPSGVPFIRNSAEVAADPALGMLSVIYHGDDREVAEAFLNGMTKLGPKRARTYYEYANALSPAGIRDILEVIVSTSPPERFSAFAKLHYSEGRTDGEAEGEPKGQAKMLLRVLKGRGIPVDDHSRRRIQACTDEETFDVRGERAPKIDKIEDLFKD